MPPKSPSFFPKARPPAPFPTRGVPGGWRDPWDTEPLPRMLVLPPSEVQRRSVRDADLRIELVARAQQDGRWVASVATGEVPPFASAAAGLPAQPRTSTWPSVNGSTSTVALDALEAELRDAVCGARPDADATL
jgi:hypothetical protein